MPLENLTHREALALDLESYAPGGPLPRRRGERPLDMSATTPLWIQQVRERVPLLTLAEALGFEVAAGTGRKKPRACVTNRSRPCARRRSKAWPAPVWETWTTPNPAAEEG